MPATISRRFGGLPALSLLTALCLPGCGSVPSAAAPGPVSSSAPPDAANPPDAAPRAATPPAAAMGAPAEPTMAQRFELWLAAFRDSARAAGIDEATLRVLDTARYRAHGLEADRTQPEFTRSLWDYLDASITPRRVATGQQKLAQFRAEADAASARYGVPPSILIAVWGIESNYGLNYGDIPVFDALATLGVEGRREAWARQELMAALTIVQRGDIEPARMVGSWAGAMGQTQFMPSSYLSYAVDADGDGRRDIWGSMADVLASTAHYLAKAGWRTDEPVLVEVKLPADFDPARADAATRQDSARWGSEGVRQIDGSDLPAMADAAILQPAGVRGPAFLTGRNYRSILRYNNATSYALTVSLLAQQIAGGPGVVATWPRELQALSRQDVKALQTALAEHGFDSGTPDGQFGPATRQALRAFQRSKGLPPDGYPTLDLLEMLRKP